MRKYLNLVLLLLVTLMFSGCFSIWKHLKRQDYKDRKRVFTAQVPVDWMRHNWSNYFLMTKDGTALNYVRVDRMKFKSELEYTNKKYNQEMLPPELAEVSINNFQSNKNISFFRVLKNEPADINGEDAYNIEYSFETKSGLKKKGIEYGFIFDEHAYRIRFEAADQHYYASTENDFNEFLSSFQLIRKEEKN